MAGQITSRTLPPAHASSLVKLDPTHALYVGGWNRGYINGSEVDTYLFEAHVLEVVRGGSGSPRVERKPCLVRDGGGALTHPRDMPSGLLAQGVFWTWGGGSLWSDDAIQKDMLVLHPSWAQPSAPPAETEPTASTPSAQQAAESPPPVAAATLWADVTWDIVRCSGPSPGHRQGHSFTLLPSDKPVFGTMPRAGTSHALLMGGQSRRGSHNDVWLARLSARVTLGGRTSKWYACFHSVQGGGQPGRLHLEVAWEQLQPHGDPPPPRMGHSAAWSNGSLWVFGGARWQAYDATTHNDIKRLDGEAMEWVGRGRMPSHAAVSEPSEAPAQDVEQASPPGRRRTRSQRAAAAAPPSADSLWLPARLACLAVSKSRVEGMMWRNCILSRGGPGMVRCRCGLYCCAIESATPCVLHPHWQLEPVDMAKPGVAEEIAERDNILRILVSQCDAWGLLAPDSNTRWPLLPTAAHQDHIHDPRNKHPWYPRSSPCRRFAHAWVDIGDSKLMLHGGWAFLRDGGSMPAWEVPQAATPHTAHASTAALPPLASRSALVQYRGEGEIVKSPEPGSLRVGGSVFMPLTHVFCTRTEHWQSLRDALPPNTAAAMATCGPRMGHSFLVIDDFLLVVGGHTGSHPVSEPRLLPLRQRPDLPPCPPPTPLQATLQKGKAVPFDFTIHAQESDSAPQSVPCHAVLWQAASGTMAVRAASGLPDASPNSITVHAAEAGVWQAIVESLYNSRVALSFAQWPLQKLLALAAAVDEWDVSHLAPAVAGALCEKVTLQTVRALVSVAGTYGGTHRLQCVCLEFLANNLLPLVAEEVEALRSGATGLCAEETPLLLAAKWLAEALPPYKDGEDMRQFILREPTKPPPCSPVFTAAVQVWVWSQAQHQPPDWTAGRHLAGL